MSRDNYPLPLIENQLDKLRGKQYFSKLLKRRPFIMAPSSIKYTSFIMLLRQFEFMKMSFGKIGLQKFQRFITEVMTDLIRTGAVIIYMNDILIANESREVHIETLKVVLSLLVENKLELRPEKYLLIVTEIEYLGYIVTRRDTTDGQWDSSSTEFFRAQDNKRSAKLYWIGILFPKIH